MSLTAINKSRQDNRLTAEKNKALWQSRFAWARAYAKPAIESVLNEAYLKTLLGEITESAYQDISSNDQVVLGERGASYGTSLTMLHGAMVGRTVYANPSAMDNYQFMCGVTGRCSDPSRKCASTRGYEEFSLAFSGSQYYSTSRGGNSHHTSGYAVYVGLPGPADDPTTWFADQVRKYFEYWIKHCTNTPETHSRRENENYNERLYFKWPEKF